MKATGAKPRTPVVERAQPGDAGVRLIESGAALAEFRRDWPTLRADLAGPTSELDWMLAHVEALPGDQRLHAVALVEDDRLTALAPLVASTRRFPARLTWLGKDDVSSALYEDESRLQQLAVAIYRLRQPVMIDGLLPGAPTARALLRHCPEWIQISRSRWGGPSLPLDATWVAPLDKLGKKRRREMERTWRKAQDMGEVRFDVHLPDGDVLECLDEYVHLEASGWKGRAGTSLAHNHQERETLRHYLPRAAERGSVRITRMRIGDATAAMHLNVVAAGRWWGLKGAVDERFRSASPGMHLFAFTIGTAAEEGLERFEFMGGTAPFKEMWGAGGVELSRWSVYPATPSGTVALMGEFARRGQRKVSRELDHRGVRLRPGPPRSTPAG